MAEGRTLTKSEMLTLVREFGGIRRTRGDEFHEEPHTKAIFLYTRGSRSGRTERVGIYVFGSEQSWTISIYAAPRVRVRPTYELYRYISRWRTTVKLAAPYVVEDGESAAVMCEVAHQSGQVWGTEAAAELLRTTIDLVGQVSGEIAKDLSAADGFEFTVPGVAGPGLLHSWWDIVDQRVERALGGAGA